LEAKLIAFHSNGLTDAVAYGTLDPTTGVSSVVSTFNGLRETNTDQYAYNDKNNYLTFVGFDAVTYVPLLVTLDGQKGLQLMNTTVPFGPVPFGFHYDSVLSILIGQSWNSNGTGYLVKLDATKSVVTSYLKSYLVGTFNFLSSTIDPTKHIYYFTYLVSLPTAINQTLWAYDYSANNVISNVTIKVIDITNPVTNLVYSNNTNTLYGMLYRSSVKAADVVSINPQNGVFTYLSIFTNSTYGSDIRSVAIDARSNLLYVIFETDTPQLVTVDLVGKKIQSSVVIKGVPLVDMLIVVYCC